MRIATPGQHRRSLAREDLQPLDRPVHHPMQRPQLGVPHRDEAVRQQRLLPVAPRVADRQELVRHQPPPADRPQRVVPDDARDAPLPLRPLEHHAHVVAAGGGDIDRQPADRAGPVHEEVDVVRPVVHVDEVPAAVAARHLPEHDLAVRLPVPLHVGEAGVHAQDPQDVGAELDAFGELRHRVGVGVDDLRRADPLLGAEHQGAREVLRDAVEDDLAVPADGVVGELLPVDELLDAGLGDVPAEGQRQLQLVAVVATERVRRAGAGDRLEDQGVAHPLRGGPRLRHRPHPVAVRHAQARRRQPLLHHLLVAEPEGDVARHAGEAEPLAHGGGEEDQRLPVRDHAIDAGAGQDRDQVIGGRRLVEEVRALHPRRQEAPCLSVHAGLGAVADAHDGGSDLGQPARERPLLGGVGGGQERDAEPAHAALTFRVRPTSSSIARSTS